MKTIILAAFIAVCSAAKLDRTYLPPSANTAGGTSDILQTPVSRNNQGLGSLPTGSYVNDHQGVVVDAALGTRSSNPVESGLGAPRDTYGSQDSKVGEAAFRDKHLQGGASFIPQGFVDVERPERVQASRDRLASTVRVENNLKPESYSYVYETDNGISAGEDGVTINGVNAKGGFSYTGDDGQVYSVTYTADKNGYQPQGAHLPTPPPIPVEILKALEQNAKDEAAGVVDDGSYDAKKYNAGGDYTESIGDNDRQSNKFANRPGSYDQTNGGFINQNNQDLRPNNNGQFGFISDAKDMRHPIGNVQITQNIPQGFTGFNEPNKPLPSNSEGLTNVNPSQSFNQILPNIGTQQPGISPSNTFEQNRPIQGSFTNEYLPPQQQFVQQQTIGEAKPSFNAENNQDSNKLTTSIPLSQQNLQNQDQGLIISSSRPSSYDTSITGSISPSLDLQKETIVQKPQSNLPINQGAFNRFGNSQNLGSSLPTTIPQISTSDKLQQQFPSNSFNQQQTIVPTNQPSRELTTPFEENLPTNTDNNSFHVQSIGQGPSLQGTGAQSQTVQQETASTDQPSNTYEGEIYNYNKPAPPQPTDAPSASNIVSLNYNKGPNGAFVQSQPFQKPIIGNQNIQTPFIQSRPTDATSLSPQTTNNQYNVPETAQTTLPSDEQQTTDAETLEGFNKPTTNFFSQTPTDASFSPITQGQSHNQYTQSQSSFSSQGPSFQKPLIQSNKQPVQNSFSQTRPTSPSIPQTQSLNQNQYTQPQGPDGSYYYDRPSKPFNRPSFPSTQSNQLNKITQRPEFSGQTSNAFTKPVIQSMLVASGQNPNSNQNPINGLTQASISPFGPIAQTSINNQPSGFSFNQNAQFGGEQVQPQHNSFAQAVVSTQQFPSQQSNQLHGFGQTTSISEETTPSNTYESEIYQYNKPEPSLPSTSSSESNEEDQPGSTQTTFAALPTQSTNQQEPQSSLPQKGAISKPEGGIIGGISGQKPFSRPLGSSILGSACCRGNTQFNQNAQKFEPTPNRPQQPSHVFRGPEKFDANRKPPSFDSTGYHY